MGRPGPTGVVPLTSTSRQRQPDSILISLRFSLNHPYFRPRMQASDFDFALPDELIAQQPLTQRDASRLLVLDRASRSICHKQFLDLPRHLHPNDLLVLNDSKVIPARLRGVNTQTEGRFELLLIEEQQTNDWWALLKPGKRARIGTHIRLLDATGDPAPLIAEVIDTNAEGHRRLQFHGCPDILSELDRLGEMPLPPYIRRKATEADLSRYQTVFARPPGSVAAPTAGLHFTPAIMDRLKEHGIRMVHVTLHVGLGTFAPVKSETLEGHVMHEERYAISPEAAAQINAQRQRGQRVVAVGTTALRTLESAGTPDGVRAGAGRTRLFVRPPCTFNVVDALLTNFHLPRSTLLMLVSAFAQPGSTEGRRMILEAYNEAVAHRYRFFSYGDAMLIQ